MLEQTTVLVTELLKTSHLNPIEEAMMRNYFNKVISASFISHKYINGKLFYLRLSIHVQASMLRISSKGEEKKFRRNEKVFHLPPSCIFSPFNCNFHFTRLIAWVHSSEKRIKENHRFLCIIYRSFTLCALRRVWEIAVSKKCIVSTK